MSHRLPVHPKSLLFLGLLMATCVTAMSVGLVVWRYNQVLESARSNLDDVTNLLGSQSEQALKSVEGVQKQIIHRVEARASALSLPFGVAAKTPETAAEIRLLVDTVDVLTGLGIVDPAGRLLINGRAGELRSLDLADRYYFKAIKLRGLEEVWDGPFPNRGDGSQTIFHAMRIDAVDGSLQGVLVSLLSVNEIERQFGSVNLTRGSSITLEQRDGTVLARYAVPGSRAGSIKEAFGSVLDKGDSLISSTKAVMNHPLLIRASSPRYEILSGWRKEVITIGALAIALNCTIAFAGFLGLRYLRASAVALSNEQHAARHDMLTTLPNRFYFQSHLHNLLDTGEPRPFALMLIDLDRFKEVNDTLGHAVGDRLLQVVTQRFKDTIGEHDFLARFGGDEFAILHLSGDSDFRAEDLSRRLVASLNAAVSVDNAELKISCSIGIAETSCEICTVAQLVAKADLALYKAKELGRNNAYAYSGELGLERRRKIELQNDLAAAVASSELQLYFQPIIDLEKRRVASFEALLRWSCPKRGQVSPAVFVPLAEENGLIGQIGEWVLNEATRRAASWPDDISVAVNLSPVQLLIQDVYETVRGALTRSGLDPRRLELEITESVQLHQTMAGQVLGALKALGVKIALDDFGTGYASLSYLQSFPFDVIKIDQSFIRDLIGSNESRIIVETVLSMAQKLNVDVTAEGVETVQQLHSLSSNSCPQAQGYLFAAPLPADQVLTFLETWTFPTEKSLIISRT